MKYFQLAILFAGLTFFGACNKDDDSLSAEEQLQADIEIIDRYLTDNSLSAQATASGLRYIIEEEGTGANPVAGGPVILQFSGFFADNTLWGTSNGPAVFDLSAILEGFKEGIPLFKIGGKGKLLLPSALAFGSQGANGVPANTVMIFDIELPDLCVDETTLSTKQKCLDLYKIDEYLTENSLTVDSITESGIHYIIDVEGTGGNPSSSSTVTVLYKGYLLDGTVFDETKNGSISFPLSGVIEGWKQGMKLFKKGGKGTLLIPSSLAYGGAPPTNSVIPPNAVLAFDIELVDF